MALSDETADPQAKAKNKRDTERIQILGDLHEQTVFATDVQQRLDLLDLVISLSGAILPYIANEAAKLRDEAQGSDERAHQRRG